MMGKDGVRHTQGGIIDEEIEMWYIDREKSKEWQGFCSLLNSYCVIVEKSLFYPYSTSWTGFVCVVCVDDIRHPKQILGSN